MDLEVGFEDVFAAFRARLGLVRLHSILSNIVNIFLVLLKGNLEAIVFYKITFRIF